MFQSDMVKSHASRLAQEYSLKLDFFFETQRHGEDSKSNLLHGEDSKK